MSRTNELQKSLFIYLHDIYGVDSFFDIPTKEDLGDYILAGDFIDTSMPDGISDLGRKELADVVVGFMKQPQDYVLFTETILKVVEKNNGELSQINIENFETICGGKTELGEMLIEIYVDERELDPITSISKDEEGHFLDFLDTTIDSWN